MCRYSILRALVKFNFIFLLCNRWNEFTTILFNRFCKYCKLPSQTVACSYLKLVKHGK